MTWWVLLVWIVGMQVPMSWHARRYPTYSVFTLAGFRAFRQELVDRKP